MHAGTYLLKLQTDNVILDGRGHSCPKRLLKLSRGTFSCYLLTVMLPWCIDVVAPPCSGYHYGTTSFKRAWIQVLHRFKSCSQLIRGCLWWGEPLKMVPTGNKAQPFKRQHHRMVKHTQTICLQKPTNCVSVFDHFVGLKLKRLRTFNGQSFRINKSSSSSLSSPSSSME